jgi:hypothetical protein
MITAETTIGTICHNEDNASDPDHRRIEIWVDTDGEIWADRENPQSGHAPKAKDVDDAVRMASQLWSGPAWDFHLAEALSV